MIRGWVLNSLREEHFSMQMQNHPVDMTLGTGQGVCGPHMKGKKLPQGLCF